jgi:hypothetical protein
MASRSGAESQKLATPSSYSAAARKALALTAAAVTLLPLPVTYFGILPTYHVHGRFLLFYTPFLCLLTLSYLFYVRDALARAMFADVLDPPPPPDPYYQGSAGERVGRLFRRLKGIILGILPVFLVISSMYCVSRYLVAFDRSSAAASEAYIEEVSIKEASIETASREGAGPARQKQRGKAPAEPRRSRQRVVPDSAPADSAPADTLPLLGDLPAVREHVLRTSKMQDVPDVIELTGLYFGVFVSLLAAVTLMALKEYAKEAMGFSEYELMFGRYHPSPDDERAH